MADQGYDTDLALWAESQARALRNAGHAGTNLPIDWESVAEEIEALGKSQARELASRISIILVHLIKLHASPATEITRGLARDGRPATKRYRTRPGGFASLRRTIPDVIQNESGKATRVVALALAGHGEQAKIAIGSVRYTEDQVLGDCFPGEV